MEPKILREIARNKESVGDLIPVGIVVLEENGKIAYVNEKAKELCGIDPSGLKMENHSPKLMKLLTLDGEVCPSEQLPATRALFTGKTVNDEVMIERPDGSRIIVDASASPIKDKDGEIIGALAIFQDITEPKKAEEALKSSEQLFRRAIEDAPIPIIMYAEDGEVLQLSQTWTKLTGYKINDMPDFDTWITKAVYGEGANAVRDHMLELFKGSKRSLNVEFQIRAATGEMRYWSFSASSLGSLKDGRRFIVGMAVDITERKNAEELLLSQAQIINSAQDAIFSTDESFTIKSWNRSAERLFGWSAKEAIGKSTQILKIEYPTLKGTTREQAFEQLMSNGFWKDEIIYHRKDGSPFFGSATLSLIRDQDEKTVGISAVVHDITPRKDREKRLREARHDLNRAQALGKIGSWRLDTRRNVFFWSDENYQIFGIPKGTPITYERFLDTVHPDDREYVDERWKAGLRFEPHDVEHRIVVDGKVKWVREKADLEFDEDGNVKDGFGTTQDITDFVEIREKLRYYSKHLEELVEEKTKQLRNTERMAAIGETAGMIGHDIRNPLQGMDGALYLAQDLVESLPEGSEEKKELRDIHAILREQVAYIDHMVADLQDFAKSAKPELEEIDLCEALTESLGMVDVADNVVVNVVLPEEEPLKLVADYDHLKRVFSNLIKNAVQSMPDGGELTILAYRKDKDFLVRIEDTGMGISEDVKPNIFTPLFTTKSKGQGFGLAVCKKLIEAQNGEISFQSTEGKGTTFTIKLPIRQGAEYLWSKKASL